MDRVRPEVPNMDAAIQPVSKETQEAPVHGGLVVADAPVMESALQADVTLLAVLLEEILREQEGPELAQLLDDVVAYATRARSGSADDAEALRKLLGTLSADKALPLARAFSHYLALANMAEQYHRIRVRRARRTRAESPMVEAFTRACSGGLTPQALRAAVGELQVELVLTAHPTQTMRRTILQKHRRIALALARRDRADLLPEEREETKEMLRREILALWQTDELRRKRLTPVDEAKAGLVLFDQILWDAVPAFLREVDRALHTATGSGLPLSAAPLRFGSWMGGDRDGNPNVTAKVTEEVCLLSRWEAAELYYQEVELLHDELSMTRATAELSQRAGGAAEPYRAVLKEVLGRLGATQRDCDQIMVKLRDESLYDGPVLHSSERERRAVADAKPYTSASELWEALEICERSLREVGASSVAEGQLRDLMRRVAAFGIALARVDIRQESGVHASALDAITQALGLGSYLAWSEEERVAFLLRELESARPLLPRTLPDSALLRE
ncbi:MAG TPA: phosphoenolpyruvate carboxylase, partial [Polyangiales bacterium]|nr:phosphoenolpyruvate carboxylase [Polyangiales bacterium]